jgi:hypothetical protein
MSRDLAVAVGDRVIDGQRIEAALQSAQPK